MCTINHVPTLGLHRYLAHVLFVIQCTVKLRIAKNGIVIEFVSHVQCWCLKLCTRIIMCVGGCRCMSKWVDRWFGFFFFFYGCVGYIGFMGVLDGLKEGERVA